VRGHGRGPRYHKGINDVFFKAAARFHVSKLIFGYLLSSAAILPCWRKWIEEGLPGEES